MITNLQGLQLQNTLMGRYEIAKEVSLDTYSKRRCKQWNKPLTMETLQGTLPMGKVDLWDAFDDTRWYSL